MPLQATRKGWKPPDLKHLRPLTPGPLRETPLISVLVTNYNYEKYIGEAIQSVLAQTYANFELVICDDGSTDESCAVIESWCRKDRRVCLIRQANGGQGAALNTAFGVAKGDVIALLDGDDLALEHRLELVVESFRQHPETGMVIHALKVLDAQGQSGGQDPELPLDEGWLALSVLRGPGPVFPPTSGLALRTEVAKRVFPLPCVLIPEAHWDWVVREGAALLAPVAALREAHGVYRLHGRSLFGHSHLSKPEQIESRLAGLSGAMEGRRIYARAFLNAEPNPAECDLVVGVLVLSRALLRGDHMSPKDISRYAAGGSRWIWRLLFLLPNRVSKRFYLWGRKSEIRWKIRRIKGQTVRLLERLAGLLGMRWKPGRRVRQRHC